VLGFEASVVGEMLLDAGPTDPVGNGATGERAEDRSVLMLWRVIKLEHFSTNEW
jgi:hypothetical protein